MSAFTIAFQVPNLVRSLFADAAIQAAFVPVFTEQLERGNKREAFRLASTLIFLVTLVLTALTALFILIAPVLMPLFVRLATCPQDLTVTLSQILFPILVMLGTTGMVVGILNSYDRFGAFAISPFFWNVAIIAVLVALAPAVSRRRPDLRLRDRRAGRDRDPARDPGLGPAPHAVPAAAGLRLAKPRGAAGAAADAAGDAQPRADQLQPADQQHLRHRWSPTQAPAAIDKAFRIYMLPQGIFSVAVTTVLFPTLARLAARREYDDLRATMANGMRQIVLLLIPAAAAILVLSVPMIRLVYQRGEFNAGRHRPRRHGALLVRLLAALQRPLPAADPDLLQPPAALGARPRSRASTWRSRRSPRCALYQPFGVGGIVAATVIATAASVLAQAVVLRRQLGRLELGQADMDHGSGQRRRRRARGRELRRLVRPRPGARARPRRPGRLAERPASAPAPLVYAAAITLLRIPEAQQIWRLLRGREPGTT